MGIWFNVSFLGFILILVPYFLSLEHSKLESLFGERSIVVGDTIGLVSGWGFFIFWFGLWIAPQNQFQWGSPLFHLLGYTFTAAGLGLSLMLLIPAFWFGIKGVTELGLRVSETHRPVKVVKTGVYKAVRHPQYFGGLLGHIGVSFLLSSRDAILVTPIVLVVVYFLCWKEEKELIKEFGQEYEIYQQKVPMLVPKIRSEKIV